MQIEKRSIGVVTSFGIAAGMLRPHNLAFSTMDSALRYERGDGGSIPPMPTNIIVP